MRRFVIAGLLMAVGAVVAQPASVTHALPGANGKIAFDSKRSGNLDIYTMNPDGTGVTQLTTNAADDGQPAWSPDGTQIAFHSMRDGHVQVYVMNADGSNQHRVSGGPTDDASPTWSPDGKQLAFDSDRLHNFQVFVVNADGMGEHNVTNSAADDSTPAWSPDGAKISFESNRGGGFDIWVMNADGSGAVNLTHGSGDSLSSAWSPDGTKIAFDTNRSGNYDLWTMNPDGSAPAQLTTSTAEDYLAAYSPDGSKIAFTSKRDGNSEVYVMNANGSGQTRVTNNAAVDAHPDWQPLTCTVTTVVSGNVFKCTDGRSVRMLQMAAPGTGECGGDWAQAALQFIFLPAGRVVRLQYDTTLKDGAGNDLAAPLWRGDDGADYNLSIVMVYVGLAKAATVGAGNAHFLAWANASQGWAQAAQWNMWAPGKPFNGGC